MAEPRTRPFNPNVDRNLDIEGIIGAPLVAAARANSMMLKEQAKFLMDFCFSKNGDVYDPVMVQLSITKSVLDPGEGPGANPRIRQIKTTFSLPILTIIPINSLAVETVSVEFDLEITTHTEQDRDEDRSSTRSLGTSDPKVKLRGKISYDSKEQSNRAEKNQYRSENASKLKVNVQAGPLPLPVGVQTILDLYSKAIQPTSKAKPRARINREYPP